MTEYQDVLGLTSRDRERIDAIARDVRRHPKIYTFAGHSLDREYSIAACRKREPELPTTDSRLNTYSWPPQARINLAIRDLQQYRHTLNPAKRMDEDTAWRVLLLCWLVTDEDANTFEPRITELQNHAISPVDLPDELVSQFREATDEDRHWIVFQAAHLCVPDWPAWMALVKEAWERVRHPVQVARNVQVAMAILLDATLELGRRRDEKEQGTITAESFAKYQRRVYSPAAERYNRASEALVPELVQRQTGTLPLREWEAAKHNRPVFERAFTWLTSVIDELAGEDSHSIPDPGAKAEIKPHYDDQRRELIYRNKVVKALRQKAENQEAVLRAFEEEGWPPRIDDPLPWKQGVNAKHRVSLTVQRLNRSQAFIRFSTDGTGEGILWQTA